MPDLNSQPLQLFGGVDNRNNINFQITLNKACNWNCSYCCQPAKSSYKKRDDDFIIDQVNIYMNLISKTNNTFELSLIGGEPGLWSEKIWEAILQSISKYRKQISKITIFTNGTFFKHPIVKKINNIDRIKFKINYHCISELHEMKYIDVIKGWISEYIIVLTHDNIKYLEKFLLKNKHIHFTALLSVTDVYGPDKEIYEEDYDKIKIISKKVNNFNYDSLNKNKKIDPISLKALQEKCSRDSKSLLIDICEQSFSVCCFTKTFYDLTEENFYGFIHKTLNKMDCGSCSIPAGFDENNCFNNK